MVKYFIVRFTHRVIGRSTFLCEKYIEQNYNYYYSIDWSVNLPSVQYIIVMYIYYLLLINNNLKAFSFVCILLKPSSYCNVEFEEMWYDCL